MNWQTPISKDELYGSSQVAKNLGITLRQLNHWVDDLDVAKPVLQQFGCRQYRRFDFEDVNKLGKMKALVDKGYKPRAAAVIIKSKN